MPTFLAGYESRILYGAHHLSLITNGMTPGVSQAMLPTTVVVDTSAAVIPGLKDASLTVQCQFDKDNAAGDVGPYLLAQVSASAGQPASVAPRGFTVGYPVWVGDDYLASIAPSSSVDGLVVQPLTFTSRGAAAWGHALTALQTVTSTTTGTSVDFIGAPTTSGAVANLHVTAISGTPTFTVTIQDSADNSSWSTIGTFTALSASKGAQRLSIAGTIRRYLRAVGTVSGGTTPSITYQVSMARLTLS